MYTAHTGKEVEIEKKHAHGMIVNEKVGDVMATDNQKALKKKRDPESNQ